MKQKLWGRNTFIWLGLNALDAITTLIALEAGAREGNLSISWLVLYPQGWYTFKVLASLLMLETLFIVKRMELLQYANYVMGAIVVWNMINIV